MTATLGKRSSYRPVAPTIAGIVPTITGEFKLDYTGSVTGATTETFACSVSTSVSNWNSVPDLVVNVFGRAPRSDLTSTGVTNSSVYAGGKITLDSENFSDFDWMRAQLSLTDWRSLNSITFKASRAYSVLVEVEVNSVVMQAVIGGEHPLEATWDYGELSGVAADVETDVVYIRVYFLDESGYGTYPASWTAGDGDAYFLSNLPVTIELDFYNTFETLEGIAFLGGLGALTAVGLSELTAKGIERIVSKDGMLGQVAPHLVGMAAPIGVVLGILWLEGWITTLKDLEAIVINLPVVASSLLIGTAGSFGSSLIRKYSGVSSEIASLMGGAVDAGSKAIMTATLLAALAVIGFDMRPAGNLE